MDNKLDAILRILELHKCHYCGGNQKNGGNEGGGGYETNATGSMDIPLSEATSINEMDNLPNDLTGTLESEELTRRLERLKDEESFDAEGKERSGSRFTVTPSFLMPEPTLMHGKSIDLNSSPDSSAENTQNEDGVKNVAFPLSSNMKKYRSTPNLPKPRTLKDDILVRDELKRSSSVHFDESSLIKHRSSTHPSLVPLHEVTSPPPHPPPSELCGDAYVSDLDSLDSNSVTPPTEQSNLSNSRENNKTNNDGGDGVAIEMTPINTTTSSSEPTLLLSQTQPTPSENGHIQHNIET